SVVECLNQQLYRKIVVEYLHEKIKILICFFFSSRRRHTISKRDWSSDVCSSDLPGVAPLRPVVRGLHLAAVLKRLAEETELVAQIGRASCRDRMRSIGGDDKTEK